MFVKSTLSSALGARVRTLRRRHGISQSELASKLGVSPSYLNMIEAGKRALPSHLLLALARQFDLDLAELSGEPDAELLSDAMVALADPMFDNLGLRQDDVRLFAQDHPDLARALVMLYDAHRSRGDAFVALADRLGDETLGLGGEEGRGPSPRLPSEEVSDLIQRHRNHFSELEEAAEQLVAKARFAHHATEEGLTRHLASAHNVRVRLEQAGSAKRLLRSFDPERRELVVSEMLPPRSRLFQLAHQICLLEHSAALERVARDPGLTTDSARGICRVALANYFAAAVLMPYSAFVAAARAERYDIELLGHRFRTSFEQVCHRLTTLRRPGDEGVPFHMVRVDIAGNISKRFSASGIRFARFSGSCPRWNVYKAFLTPALIRVQISQMPDGTSYFCVARTLPKSLGGYHTPGAVHAVGLGCRLEHAPALVYADGVALSDPSSAVPVGITCRLCDRSDCAQRAFPAIHRPLAVDENIRGMSFYAPGLEDSDLLG
jgi:hypothetical protein